MTNSLKNIVIVVSESDNVGVVANLGGLPKGAEILNGIRLTENVPMGHKVALCSITEGEKSGAEFLRTVTSGNDEKWKKMLFNF